MELILQELPDNYESNEKIWIYKEKIDIYNKYNQIPLVIKEEKPNIPLVVKEEKPTNISLVVKEEKPNIPLVIKEEKPNSRSVVKKENSPLELIIKYTSTSTLMKTTIKEKLIELITLPEFSKAFGVKKSAEVISALSRDGWNQSMALFISFLLDMNVIYKEKSYIFNKEKNNKILEI